jgi:hypothetical protein
MNGHPEMVDARAWANAVGIGRDRADQLVEQGRVRHIKLGRRILIRAPKSWPSANERRYS